MAKNLIICPYCAERGTRSILGDVNNGTLSIMRFHNGFTKIVGKDFSVICGNCEEKTMIRKEKDDRSDQRITWFSWVNTWQRN